jgi:hypothetical protein
MHTQTPASDARHLRSDLLMGIQGRPMNAIQAERATSVSA